MAFVKSKARDFHKIMNDDLSIKTERFAGRAIDGGMRRKGLLGKIDAMPLSKFKLMEPAARTKLMKEARQAKIENLTKEIKSTEKSLGEWKKLRERRNKTDERFGMGSDDVQIAFACYFGMEHSMAQDIRDTYLDLEMKKTELESQKTKAEKSLKRWKKQNPLVSYNQLDAVGSELPKPRKMTRIERLLAKKDRMMERLESG